MAASSPAVQAVSLTKVYGAVRAVDEVSFSVERGEVFSLLGPNGAGKTTTVEILECLRTPTSGDAYVMGLSLRDSSEVRKLKRIIGVLPQEFNAVDNLTVYENVLLAAAAKGAGRDYRGLVENLRLWPIELMLSFMQQVAQCIPLYYFHNALRHTLILSAPAQALASMIVVVATATLAVTTAIIAAKWRDL